MTDEKATEERAAEATKQEPKPDADSGAKTVEDRLAGLEDQNKELQQGLSVKDAQHKANIETIQRDSAAETERRVRQTVETQKKELATRDAQHAAEIRDSKIADAQRRADQGEEGALDALATLAREPHQQARQTEEAEKIRTDAQAAGEQAGWFNAFTQDLNARLEKLKPSDERKAELIGLFNAGKYQEVKDEMAKDEGGGSEMEALKKRLDELEGTKKEVETEEAVQKAREGDGADLGGGTPAGNTDKSEEQRAYAAGETNEYPG